MDDGQDVVVAGDELRHRVHVARLRTAALQIPVLEVRGRDLQRVAEPFASGEAAPAVWRIGGRMRPAVHEDRPVRAIACTGGGTRAFHASADPVPSGCARRRRRATGAGAECGRHWYLGRAPDRFRGRVGAQPARLVEGDAEVIGQRRLPGVLGVVEPPFARDIRRPRHPGPTGGRRRAWRRQGPGEAVQAAFGWVCSCRLESEPPVAGGVRRLWTRGGL